jgi:DNA-damage-inducible protein J
MTTIQIRIDEATKQSAKKILDQVGLDISSAIKIYLKQIVITRCIPFQILTENGLTVKQEMEILKASEEAKRGENIAAITNTWEETKAYLDSLKKNQHEDKTPQQVQKELRKTQRKNAKKSK